MRIQANRLLQLLVVMAAGCTVPAVDYTGKTCEVAEDCPNGLVCDPVTKTCQSSAGTPTDAGTVADASVAKDGGAQGDGGAVENDGGVVEGDGGVVEGDGGLGVDGSVPTGDAGTRVPFVLQTSGGGEGTSANFKLQLQAAAPQPSGTGSSASYRLQLGPASP